MKTFHAWIKAENKIRSFAMERTDVVGFRRGRKSKYLVLFPTLYNWAVENAPVTRKQLKIKGSELMVEHEFVQRKYITHIYDSL